MFIINEDNRNTPVKLTPRQLARIYVESQGWSIHSASLDYETGIYHLYCDYIKEDGAYKKCNDNVSYEIRVLFKPTNRTNYATGDNELVFYKPVLIHD